MAAGFGFVRPGAAPRPLRTDNASPTFFRQRITSLLSPRTDSASLRLVAEATAVRDVPALVGARCSAGRVREALLVATRETAGIGGGTRAVLPHHRPRSLLPGDAPEGRCRLGPTPGGVESVGSGRPSWRGCGGGRMTLRTKRGVVGSQPG